MNTRALDLQENYGLQSMTIPTIAVDWGYPCKQLHHLVFTYRLSFAMYTPCCRDGGATYLRDGGWGLCYRFCERPPDSRRGVLPGEVELPAGRISIRSVLIRRMKISRRQHGSVSMGHGYGSLGTIICRCIRTITHKCLPFLIKVCSKNIHQDPVKIFQSGFD